MPYSKPEILDAWDAFDAVHGVQKGHCLTTANTSAKPLRRTKPTSKSGI